MWLDYHRRVDGFWLLPHELRKQIKEFDELLIGEKPIDHLNVYQVEWEWEFPISGIRGVTFNFDENIDWGTGDRIIGMAMDSCRSGENVPIRVLL